MNLLDARRLRKAKANHSILIYGPPKSGKTLFVASACELPEINKIHWMDLENGSETILNAGFTDTGLSKIELYKIVDTREQPRAIETILKAIPSQAAVNICHAHGSVDCKICTAQKAGFSVFDMKKLTHNDLLVIDSGSQLGASALNAACLGKGVLYKPLLDDYGSMGKWLTDILMTIQQCEYTNIIVITQELSEKGEDGVEKLFPLIGTRNFSTGVTKYFGTVAYTGVKLGKHVIGSSSTYKANLVTGSRLNIALEKESNPSMKSLLVDGGIL